MSLTKRPVQIYLDERRNRALRWLARERNTTVSELIRRGIDLLLAQTPPKDDPAYQMIGLFSSGLHDLAEEHDEYLVREIEKETK